MKGDDGIEGVAQIVIGLPGATRDIILKYWSNDSLDDEDGKFYFFSNSVAEIDPPLEDAGVYGWNPTDNNDVPKPQHVAKVATIEYCAVMVTVLTRTSFLVSFVSEINPRITILPKSFFEQ